MLRISTYISIYTDRSSVSTTAIVVFITIVMTVSSVGTVIGIDFLSSSSALYVTYLPTPLVLLTEQDGSQNVYIAPEAYKVASEEFKDEIAFWQNALPGKLKGQLSSVRL